MLYSLSPVGLSATTWTVALPGYPVHGMLQARILEWVSIPSSRGIFPTQGLNVDRQYRQAGSLPLSHLGSSETDGRRQKRIAFCFHPRESCLSNTPVTYAAPRRVLKTYQEYAVISWISQRVVLGREKES